MSFITCFSGSYGHSGGILISKHGDLKLTIREGAIKDEDVVTFSIASDLYGPFYRNKLKMEFKLVIE